MTLPDVFTKEIWAKNEIDQVSKYLFSKLGPGQDCIDQHGIHKGNLVVNECPFDIYQHSFLVETIVNPIKKVFLDHGAKFDVVFADRVILYRPWDVHTDYEKFESDNSYNCLIPLDDTNSNTIVFDQSGNYKHFYMYKQKNTPVDNSVDEEFWNNNLAHCRPEDRKYLTVKDIGPPQKRGHAQFLKRTLFHSSDCFHLNGITSKKFLQLYVNEM